MSVPPGWTPDPEKVAAYRADVLAEIAGLEHAVEVLHRAYEDTDRELHQRRGQLEAFDAQVARYTPAAAGDEHPQSGPPPAEGGAPPAPTT